MTTEENVLGELKARLHVQDHESVLRLCRMYATVLVKSEALIRIYIETLMRSGRYNQALAECHKIRDVYRPRDAALMKSVDEWRLQALAANSSARGKGPSSVDVSPHAMNLVTVSMTSGRRWNLFKRTMDSFLHACQDRASVHRWICVDDNSSEGDRASMKRLYPFFEFVWKTPAETGHANSMQRISDMTQTPYLLHLEDDWEFFDRRSYISDMIEILESDATVDQVVCNLHYAEQPEQKFGGGVDAFTKFNLHYVCHEYCPTPASRQLFDERVPSTLLRCNHWPHFSLQPSMIRTRALNVNSFVAEPGFEHKFALRFYAQGRRTAFLGGVHARHIGRSVKDSRDSNQLTVFNAYDMLHQAQAASSKRYRAVLVSPGDEPGESSACIDGYIFEKLSRGADAETHMRMWTQLVESDDHEWLVVMHSDSAVHDGCNYFGAFLTRLLSVMTAGVHDVVCMSPPDKWTGGKRLEPFPKFRRADTMRGMYVVSKIGALKLTASADKLRGVHRVVEIDALS